MPDREEIIKGARQFIADFKPFCGNKSDWQRVDDAIALLKAQEPRMLTMNEIPEHDGAVFIEYKNGDEDWGIYVYEDGPFFKFNMLTAGVMLPLEDYGVEWRAWTGRPTAEQRWPE